MFGGYAGRRVSRALVAITFAFQSLAGAATAQQCEDTPEGRICSIPQAIVAGAPVDPPVQKALGLVTVGGGCSGTLLNRYWVLTARHCVTQAPPVPGSARTVNNAISNPLAPPAAIQVTAQPWADGRVAQASRIYDFAANAATLAANVDATNIADIVLVYLGAADLGPVDSQRIYMIALDQGGNSVVLSGRLRTTDIVTQYGQGFSTLATGTFGTPTAQAAQGLGAYRSARFSPSNITATGYDLALTAGQVGQGGDSGGPTVVTVNDLGTGIAGVQSTCNGTLIPNAPAPPPFLWQWAQSIAFCSYVATEPFEAEIRRVVAEAPSCVDDPSCNVPTLVGAALQVVR